MDKQTPEKLAPHLVEPLTVLPVALDPRRFYVAGRIHNEEQCWYLVFLGDERHCPACECAYHVKRLAGTRKLCAHLKAAVEFVDRGRRSAADLAVGWFLSLSETERKDLFR